ncbi:hypothetical protein Q3G72_003282 [Acer saccharum]|nr:hypothetical protein Q3G72_003282 [Acer saccharum]
MESIPCFTNLLATRRAHNIPRCMNWLFQLKPNDLDDEFKDEVDAVEDDKITTIFSKEIQALESRIIHNFNMIRKEITFLNYMRHGDLHDEDEEPVRGVNPIDLTSFDSSTLNINIPNEISSVIALEKKDPKVRYKDGQAREQKKFTYLKNVTIQNKFTYLKNVTTVQNNKHITYKFIRSLALIIWACFLIVSDSSINTTFSFLTNSNFLSN